MVSLVNNIKDLPGVKIYNGRHQRFNPFPDVGLSIFEEADGAEAVLIDPEHARPEEICVRQLFAAMFIAFRTSNQQADYLATGGQKLMAFDR